MIMEHSKRNAGNARLSFTNNVLVLIFLMLPSVCIVPQVKCTNTFMQSKASPCCSFPCKNGGSCIETCEGYKCDCTGTHHYGRNCHIELMSHRLRKSLQMGAMKLGLSNFVTDMRLVQYEPKFSKEHGGFCNENFNVCQEPMLLSPVPEHCPTPLGISGFQILPPIESLFDLVLKRRCTIEHKSSSTNLLFVIFAQFLAHQMWGGTNSNWIGSSAMYGSFVRKGVNGKVTKQHNNQDGNMYQNVFTDTFHGIILLEHNRVCDILSQLHPKWNDHRLFETATLIVTGEVLTIASTEWLPLLHDFGGIVNKKSTYPYVVSNKVPKEVKLAFLWPQMFPDSVNIEGSSLNLGILMNGMDKALPQGGYYQLMKFLATTTPRKMGPQNVPTDMKELTEKLIIEGRKCKFQSFNNYREYLGLVRLQSTAKLTNNNVVQKNLEKMYRDINGLELIPGLLLETPKEGGILGETTVALISNTILKAIVTHPLNTVPLKKKFTFGGKTGWDIVKNAKIRSLVCNNVCDKRLCEKEGLISFDRKEQKIHHPASSGATPVKVEKFEKTGCSKKATKNSVPAKKCSLLTPVKSVCSKDGTKMAISEKPKDIELPLKSPCEPTTKQCHEKAPPVVEIQAKTCTVKAGVKTMDHPQQSKKFCIRRPWLRSSLQKVPKCEPQTASGLSTCSEKPNSIESTHEAPCMPLSGQNQMKSPPDVQAKRCTNNAEVKTPGSPKKCCTRRPWFRSSPQEVPKCEPQAASGVLLCSEKPKDTESLQKSPCAPLSGQHHMKSRPVQAKTCASKVEVKTTDCPKKCCIRRPLFRTSNQILTKGEPHTTNSASACSEKPENMGKLRKSACTPLAGQCHVETPSEQAKTCTDKVEVVTTDCPQQTKKRCVKRFWTWLWTSYKKANQPCPEKPKFSKTVQKSPCEQPRGQCQSKTLHEKQPPVKTCSKDKTTACPGLKKCCHKLPWLKTGPTKATAHSKLSSSKKPTEMSATCKTPVKPQQTTRCCGKRSWFGIWK